jgi:hypothetical protein
VTFFPQGGERPLVDAKSARTIASLFVASPPVFVMPFVRRLIVLLFAVVGTSVLAAWAWDRTDAASGRAPVEQSTR